MIASRSSMKRDVLFDTRLRFFTHTSLYVSTTALSMSSARLVDRSVYDRLSMVDFLSPMATERPPRKRPVAEFRSLLRTSMRLPLPPALA